MWKLRGKEKKLERKSDYVRRLERIEKLEDKISEVRKISDEIKENDRKLEIEKQERLERIEKEKARKAKQKLQKENDRIEKLEKHQQLIDKWGLLRWSTEHLNDKNENWQIEKLEIEQTIEKELLEWEKMKRFEKIAKLKEVLIMEREPNDKIGPSSQNSEKEKVWKMKETAEDVIEINDDDQNDNNDTKAPHNKPEEEEKTTQPKTEDNPPLQILLKPPTLVLKPPSMKKTHENPPTEAKISNTPTNTSFKPPEKKSKPPSPPKLNLKQKESFLKPPLATDAPIKKRKYTRKTKDNIDSTQTRKITTMFSRVPPQNAIYSDDSTQDRNARARIRVGSDRRTVASKGYSLESRDSTCARPGRQGLPPDYPCSIQFNSAKPELPDLAQSDENTKNFINKKDLGDYKTESDGLERCQER